VTAALLFGEPWPSKLGSAATTAAAADQRSWLQAPDASLQLISSCILHDVELLMMKEPLS
jgi:hypothetical protein